MPEETDDCVKSVMEDNPEMSESEAWAICKAQKEGFDFDELESQALTDVDETLADTEDSVETQLDYLAQSDHSPWIRDHSEQGIAWIDPTAGAVVYEQESYDDYPEAAKENAQQAIDWREKHGRDEVTGGTQVGWTRANQLANGEALSRETVGRMAAFRRHEDNAEIDAEHEGEPWKDNGYVAWLLWGGDEGVSWAERKLEQEDTSEEQADDLDGSLVVDGLSQEAREYVESTYAVETAVYQADIPDEAVNIQDRSEAPEDAEIITGDRGGLYYIPVDEEADGKDSNSDIGFTVSEVRSDDFGADDVSGLADELPKTPGESELWDRHTPADDAPSIGDEVMIREGGENTVAVAVEQDGVPDGGLRVMTPNGESTVSLRRNVTHTFDESGEIDAPEDVSEISARSPDDAIDSINADEFGFEGGRNIDNMTVHTFSDGSFTVETDFEGREEFGRRATVASNVINELGGSSPEHRFEDGNLLVGGVDGSELADVDVSDINKDNLVDTLSAAALVGDGDLSRDSFIVDESGDTHAIDLEMASFGSMSPDDSLRPLENIIESLDLPTDIEEIENRMEEMSNGTERSDLVDSSEFEDEALDISSNVVGFEK